MLCEVVAAVMGALSAGPLSRAMETPVMVLTFWLVLLPAALLPAVTVQHLMAAPVAMELGVPRPLLVVLTQKVFVLWKSMA